MMTIVVECPTCESTFHVDEFDETQETEDTTCPECGHELEITEYDPVTEEYYIEDVTERPAPADEAEQADLEGFGENLEDEGDAAEEGTVLIVTEDEEDDQEEEA